MAYSRLELARGVVSHLGELVTIRADQDSTDARTIISTTQLTMPQGAYDGRQVWYVSTQSDSVLNRQTSRRIVFCNPTATSISVDADWPAFPMSGDVVDLVNFKGMSVRMEEVHTKINMLIDRVADEMAIPEEMEAVTFNALAPSLAYPPSWDWILAAQWQDSTGLWHPIFKQDLEMDASSGAVQILNVPRRKLSGSKVRLIGATRLDDLNDDRDTTVVSKSWLCMQAAAELKREASQRRGDAATDLTIANMMLADAQSLRDMVSRQYTFKGGFRWSTNR